MRKIKMGGLLVIIVILAALLFVQEDKLELLLKTNSCSQSELEKWTLLENVESSLLKELGDWEVLGSEKMRNTQKNYLLRSTWDGFCDNTHPGMFTSLLVDDVEVALSCMQKDRLAYAYMSAYQTLSKDVSRENDSSMMLLKAYDKHSHVQ